MHISIGLISAGLISSLVWLIYRANSISNRRTRQTREDFLEAEAKANATRRADISGLPYLQIEEALLSLPLDKAESAGAAREVKLMKELVPKRILNLSMYTNTELKSMYGPANLEELSAADDRFTELIRLLNAMGKKLVEAGDTASARSVLEYAVSIDSDISETFTMLAEIYISEKDTPAFDALYAKAEAITSISRDLTLSKLNSIKSNAL
ncbi:MAG: hypothetical protein IKO61_01525 [Lachnospiraceae bacterium]|nr:hypothetical protein [Lachnospiraceae bacterium]